MSKIKRNIDNGAWTPIVAPNKDIIITAGYVWIGDAAYVPEYPKDGLKSDGYPRIYIELPFEMGVPIIEKLRFVQTSDLLPHREWAPGGVYSINTQIMLRTILYIISPSPYTVSYGYYDVGAERNIFLCQKSDICVMVNCDGAIFMPNSFSIPYI